MEYKRENAAQLADLLRKGTLDPERTAKAREYIRGYLVNNPQEQGSPLAQSLATVQTMRGGQTAAAPEQSGIQAFEAAAPEVAQRYASNQAELDAEKTARSPAQYPPEFAREAGMHPQTTTIADQQRQQFHQAAQQADDALGQALDANKDATLPSASKVKNYYRPPESVAGAGNINGISTNAPIYYSEPSLDEFKREMRPQFASGVNQFTENSPAFQVWRDMRYASAYDRAKATGKPIVRVDYAQSGEWKKIAQKVIGGASAALPAALDTGTLGLSRLVLPKSVNAENQLQEESSPVGTTIGGVAGMVTPGNLAERAFGGIAKGINAIPGVRQLETGTLGRLGVAGLKGAAGGAALGATEDATHALNQAIEERSAAGLVPDAGTGRRALARAAIGMPLGMGFELLGAGAQQARKRLRDPTKFDDVARDVRRLDEAGAQFGLRGVKPSPAMESDIKTATKRNVRPEEVAVEELAPRLIARAGRTQVEVRAAAKKLKEDAIAQYEHIGNPVFVPWDAIDAAVRRMQNRLDEQGVRLPGVSIKKEAEFLKEALREPRAMPPEAAQAYVERHPDAKVYTRGEMKAAGLKLTIPVGDNDVIVMHGRPMGARTLAKWYADLREAAGAPKGTNERAKNAIAEPMNALRGFIAKELPGLSEALDKSHDALDALEAAHAATALPKEIRIETRSAKAPSGPAPKEVPGILRAELPRYGLSESNADILARMYKRRLEEKPPKPKVLVRQKAVLDPFNELPRFESALGGEKSGRATQAFKDLAGSAGELPAFKKLEGMLAARRLRGPSEVHPYITASARGPRVGGIGKWTAGRLRTDNIMKTLARLPPDEQRTLVDMVKSVRTGLKRRFGPKLNDIDRMTEEMTAEIERLNAPDYLSNAVRAEQDAAAARAGAKRTPVSADEATTPGRVSHADTEAMGKTPAEIDTARKAKIKELNSEINRLTKEFVDQHAAAHPLNAKLRSGRGGSIRGGRPGRAAAVYGQGRPKDLSKEELHLLTVLLLAPEAP